MPGHDHDDLDQLRRRKANVKPRELDTLLTLYGFRRRRGKGDHWIYSHPRLATPLSIDPRRPTLLPVYVLNAIKAMEEVLEDDAPDA